MSALGVSMAGAPHFGAGRFACDPGGALRDFVASLPTDGTVRRGRALIHIGMSGRCDGRCSPAS